MESFSLVNGLRLLATNFSARQDIIANNIIYSTGFTTFYTIWEYSVGFHMGKHAVSLPSNSIDDPTCIQAHVHKRVSVCVPVRVSVCPHHDVTNIQLRTKISSYNSMSKYRPLIVIA